MITRRSVLIVLGATAFSPGAVFAQAKQAPANVRRIGWLSSHSPSDAALWHEAFRRGLRELGWVEGRNIGIEYRNSEGRSDRLPDLAADLVRLNVEVIVASTTVDALAAQKATRDIPIVMTSVAEPVAIGLVESLARPGGNITGLGQMTGQLAGKRLELLKEIVPRLSRVAVLWNPKGAAAKHAWDDMQAPARQLRIELHSLEVRNPGEFERAFEDAARARDGALSILPDPLIVANQKRLADLAVKTRLPSVYHFSEFADAGVLVTYGTERSALFRRAATYVDKILKGAKPSDLPVEQPTKFELVINMKTAKALGIKIPQSVLQRADKVIE